MKRFASISYLKSKNILMAHFIISILHLPVLWINKFHQNRRDIRTNQKSFMDKELNVATMVRSKL